MSLNKKINTIINAELNKVNDTQKRKILVECMNQLGTEEWRKEVIDLIKRIEKK